MTNNDFFNFDSEIIKRNDYISREDAIKTIQQYGVGSYDFENYTPEQAERFVIQRLSELPPVGKDTNASSTDCVSREEAKQFLYERLDRLNDNKLYDTFSVIIDDMYNELPSVAPQQKVGQWIEKYAEDACGERYSYWACSECGRDVGFNLANIKNVLSDYPYCHCGAKMVELQERSDKE